MKKIISLLTFAAALLMPLFAASQNGFSAGVNWFTPTENRISARDFNGFGIDGAYKIGIIKRLYVEPHMGFYTSIHHNLPWPGGSYDNIGKTHAYGVNLGGDVGLKLFSFLNVFTGPDFRFDFKHHYTGDCMDKFNYSTIYWRFGLSINVWKLSLRGSYNLGLTDFEDGTDDKVDTVTLGLRYYF